MSLEAHPNDQEITLKTWVVYLIECANGALYTGITNNLERRLSAHAEGRGAKYTRANAPRRLVAKAEFDSRSAASKAEWQIKQLPRRAKASRLHLMQTEHAVGKA